MSEERINDCGRCGEDAYLVSFDGKHMVRVRRASKCKNYRPGQARLSCQTEVFQSAAAAVDEWNGSHGTSPPKAVFKLAGAPC